MVDVLVDNRELGDVLVSLQAKGRQLGAIMPAIAQILVSAVSDVYEAEGPGWKDLAESTKLARRGSSYKILQDTGAMAKSTSGGCGADWAEAFAGVSYAVFHARGTENMPRRDPFELTASAKIWGEAQQDIFDLILGEII